MTGQGRGPLTIWRDWAKDLQGVGIDSGHHIAEEAPHALVAALTLFLAQDLLQGE